MEQEAKTCTGDEIALYQDDDEFAYVSWYGLCRYNGVTFEFETASAAMLFFDACKAIKLVDAD